MRPETRPSSATARRFLLIAWGAGTVLYAGVLLFASGIPFVRELERAGGGSASGWDKLLHFAAFVVLGTLLSGFFSGLRSTSRPVPAMALAAVTGSGYATLHEGIQAWIPGFAFNPLDLMADAAGILAAVGAFFTWVRIRPRLGDSAAE